MHYKFIEILINQLILCITYHVILFVYIKLTQIFGQRDFGYFTLKNIFKNILKTNVLYIRKYS